MSAKRTTAGIASAVLLAGVAACGGSGSSASSPSSSASTGTGKTYTIGLLTDATGLAAAGNKTSVEGVKAGMAAAAKDGYHFKLVVGDTATNPAQALSAAQKLVQQDHVFVVIAHSALTFAAAKFLTDHNVPVVGVAEDGPEWQTAKNMFSAYGVIHTEKVSTTQGKIFKLLGATTVASLGHSISPASAEAAKAVGVSAQAVGLKVGYINAKFPFGSTNVQPEALAMKQHGVDGVSPATDSTVSFALIKALRNLNVNIKAFLLPTGYGGDLLNEGPATQQLAQGAYFTLTYEPIEMNTPATQAFQAALKSAGISGVPTYAMYNGYASMLLLVQGLKAAGANPTQASLINALSQIHTFSAGGLYGDHNMDVNDRVNVVTGADNCVYVTKFVGKTFQLVQGADPICGETIPGKTVSP